MADNVQVSVRVRPLMGSELESGSGSCVKISDDNKGLRLLGEGAGGSEDRNFAFDFVQDAGLPGAQLGFFEKLGEPALQHSIAGYNVSVFGYGQTGSGKSFSLFGSSHLSSTGPAGGASVPGSSSAALSSSAGARTLRSLTTRGGMGSDSLPEQAGFIPRFCAALFKRLKEGPDGPAGGGAAALGTKLEMVECSYYQIYNERVYDLLASVSSSSSAASASSSSAYGAADLEGGGGGGAGRHHGAPSAGSTSTETKLRIREHADTGPYVEGLSWHAVDSYSSIDQLIRAGNLSRAVASTNMNATSSRSHALFTLKYKRTVLDSATGGVTDVKSKITLVDLAGSERVSKTGAEGQRLKEAGSINKSLTTLGLVISALAKKGMMMMQQQQQQQQQAEGAGGGGAAGGAGAGGGQLQGQHIPYRESALTWLLKDSLGGNAKTLMLATVSPSPMQYEETLSTLRYAERAKLIRNHAVVNEDANVALIRQLRDELSMLRAQLAELKAAAAGGGSGGAAAGTAGGAGSSASAAATPSVVYVTSPELLAQVEALKMQNSFQDRLLQQLHLQWEERLKSTNAGLKKHAKGLKQAGMMMGQTGAEEEDDDEGGHGHDDDKFSGSYNPSDDEAEDEAGKGSGGAPPIIVQDQGDGGGDEDEWGEAAWAGEVVKAEEEDADWGLGGDDEDGATNTNNSDSSNAAPASTVFDSTRPPSLLLSPNASAAAGSAGGSRRRSGSFRRISAGMGHQATTGSSLLQPPVLYLRQEDSQLDRQLSYPLKFPGSAATSTSNGGNNSNAICFIGSAVDNQIRFTSAGVKDHHCTITATVVAASAATSPSRPPIASIREDEGEEGDDQLRSQSGAGAMVAEPSAAAAAGSKPSSDVTGGRPQRSSSFGFASASASASSYRFTLTADEGCRVWVNGRCLTGPSFGSNDDDDDNNNHNGASEGGEKKAEESVVLRHGDRIVFGDLPVVLTFEWPQQQQQQQQAGDDEKQQQEQSSSASFSFDQALNEWKKAKAVDDASSPSHLRITSASDDNADGDEQQRLDIDGDGMVYSASLGDLLSLEQGQQQEGDKDGNGEGGQNLATVSCSLFIGGGDGSSNGNDDGDEVDWYGDAGASVSATAAEEAGAPGALDTISASLTAEDLGGEVAGLLSELRAGIDKGLIVAAGGDAGSTREGEASRIEDGDGTAADGAELPSFSVDLSAAEGADGLTSISVSLGGLLLDEGESGSSADSGASSAEQKKEDEAPAPAPAPAAASTSTDAAAATATPQETAAVMIKARADRTAKHIDRHNKVQEAILATLLQLHAGGGGGGPSAGPSPDLSAASLLPLIKARLEARIRHFSALTAEINALLSSLSPGIILPFRLSRRLLWLPPGTCFFPNGGANSNTENKVIPRVSSGSTSGLLTWESLALKQGAIDKWMLGVTVWLMPLPSTTATATPQSQQSAKGANSNSKAAAEGSSVPLAMLSDGDARRLAFTLRRIYSHVLERGATLYLREQQQQQQARQRQQGEAAPIPLTQLEVARVAANFSILRCFSTPFRPGLRRILSYLQSNPSVTPFLLDNNAEGGAAEEEEEEGFPITPRPGSGSSGPAANPRVLVTGPLLGKAIVGLAAERLLQQQQDGEERLLKENTAFQASQAHRVVRSDIVTPWGGRLGGMTLTVKHEPQTQGGVQIVVGEPRVSLFGLNSDPSGKESADAAADNEEDDNDNEQEEDGEDDDEVLVVECRIIQPKWSSEDGNALKATVTGSLHATPFPAVPTPTPGFAFYNSPETALSPASSAAAPTPIVRRTGAHWRFKMHRKKAKAAAAADGSTKKPSARSEWTLKSYSSGGSRRKGEGGSDGGSNASASKSGGTGSSLSAAREVRLTFAGGLPLAWALECSVHAGGRGFGSSLLAGAGALSSPALHSVPSSFALGSPGNRKSFFAGAGALAFTSPLFPVGILDGVSAAGAVDGPAALLREMLESSGSNASSSTALASAGASPAAAGSLPPLAIVPTLTYADALSRGLFSLCNSANPSCGLAELSRVLSTPFTTATLFELAATLLPYHQQQQVGRSLGGSAVVGISEEEEAAAAANSTASPGRPKLLPRLSLHDFVSGSPMPSPNKRADSTGSSSSGDSASGPSASTLLSAISIPTGSEEGCSKLRLSVLADVLAGDILPLRRRTAGARTAAAGAAAAGAAVAGPTATATSSSEQSAVDGEDDDEEDAAAAAAADASLADPSSWTAVSPLPVLRLPREDDGSAAASGGANASNVAMEPVFFVPAPRPVVAATATATSAATSEGSAAGAPGTPIGSPTKTPGGANKEATGFAPTNPAASPMSGLAPVHSAPGSMRKGLFARGTSVKGTVLDSSTTTSFGAVTGKGIAKQLYAALSVTQLRDGSPFSLETCLHCHVTDVRRLPISSSVADAAAPEVSVAIQKSDEGSLPFIQHRDASGRALRVLIRLPPPRKQDKRTDGAVATTSGVLDALSDCLSQPTPRGHRVYIRLQVGLSARGTSSTVAFARWMALEVQPMPDQYPGSAVFGGADAFAMAVVHPLARSLPTKDASLLAEPLPISSSSSSSSSGFDEQEALMAAASPSSTRSAAAAAAYAKSAAETIDASIGHSPASAGLFKPHPMWLWYGQRSAIAASATSAGAGGGPSSSPPSSSPDGSAGSGSTVVTVMGLPATPFFSMSPADAWARVYALHRRCDVDIVRTWESNAPQQPAASASGANNTTAKAATEQLITLAKQHLTRTFQASKLSLAVYGGHGSNNSGGAAEGNAAASDSSSGSGAVRRGSTAGTLPVVMPALPNGASSSPWDLLLPPPELSIRMPRCDAVSVARVGPDKAGSLFKQRARLGGSVRRYYVLQPPFLAAYHSASCFEANQRPDSVMSLLEIAVGDERGNMLKLQPVHNKAELALSLSHGSSAASGLTMTATGSASAAQAAAAAAAAALAASTAAANNLSGNSHSKARYELVFANPFASTSGPVYNQNASSSFCLFHRPMGSKAPNNASSAAAGFAPGSAPATTAAGSAAPVAVAVPGAESARILQAPSVEEKVSWVYSLLLAIEQAQRVGPW